MSKENEPEGPVIEARPDGPYIVKNLETLRNSRGEALPTKPVLALCRCGASANKPFCDGTHSKIEFSGKRLTDGSADKPDTYVGQVITINDNRSICAHAGYCTDGLKSVFKYRQEPWIDPDGADVEAIIEQIGQCPSGALSYIIDGVEYSNLSWKPAITVSKDGPYHVVRGTRLVDTVTGQRPPSREHYTLCRCGASMNKPFCDGTHWHIEFEDETN